MHVRYAPVTGTAKRIVMAHKNRYLLLIKTFFCWSDMNTITDPGYQWIRKILNKIDKKTQEKFILTVTNDYSSNYPEQIQNSRSVSMETQRLRGIAYEAFKTLNDLNPNFMKEKF